MEIIKDILLAWAAVIGVMLGIAVYGLPGWVLLWFIFSK